MSSTDDSLARIVLLAIALLILLPMLMMLFAVPMMGMGWMYGPMQPGTPDGTAPGWTLGAWAVGLLVVLGVGYIVYRGLARSDTDPAMAELRRAYARGDLSDEEFEERRERLRE